MNLLRLHYFKLLAESEHLIKTAREIQISPPALRSAISSLEKELGVPLFDHVGRNICLNENGRTVYYHVCRIFAELDAIRSELSTGLQSESSTLHIGVSAPSMWTDLISSFQMSHQNITIIHSVVRQDSLDNPEYLKEYDLILTDANVIRNSGWSSEFLFSDAPVLLVPAGHRFEGRSEIAMIEARDERWIVLSSGYSSRTFFNNACMQAGFSPLIVSEVDYALRTSMIESGMGIGFSSVLGAHAIRSNIIRAVRVKYPPNPRIQSIFWKNTSSELDKVILFRDYAVNYYRNFHDTSGEGKVL